MSQKAWPTRRLLAYKAKPAALRGLDAGGEWAESGGVIQLLRGLKHENSKQQRRLAVRQTWILGPRSRVSACFRCRTRHVRPSHGQVDGSQAMNLAVHYSCIASTSGETTTHAFNLGLPEAWQRWSDFEQGRWVLDQILVHIDLANRGVRPAWLEFGYEIEDGASLPC
jgi:hypothetical protein